MAIMPRCCGRDHQSNEVKMQILKSENIDDNDQNASSCEIAMNELDETRTYMMNE